MQYFVNNITCSNCEYVEKDLDINELYDLLCTGFFYSSIPIVYESSSTIKVRRKQFKYECNYPYGYIYKDNSSGNKFLITKVPEDYPVRVQNMPVIIEEYLSIKPHFECEYLNIDSYSGLSNLIDSSLSVKDNLINLVLNKYIKIYIRSTSLNSYVKLRDGSCVNMYLFIDLVKRIYYTI